METSIYGSFAFLIQSRLSKTGYFVLFLMYVKTNKTYALTKNRSVAQSSAKHRLRWVAISCFAMYLVYEINVVVVSRVAVKDFLVVFCCLT